MRRKYLVDIDNGRDGELIITKTDNGCEVAVLGDGVFYTCQLTAEQMTEVSFALGKKKVKNKGMVCGATGEDCCHCQPGACGSRRVKE